VTVLVRINAAGGPRETDEGGRAADLTLDADSRQTRVKVFVVDSIGHRFRQCPIGLLVTERHVDRMVRRDVHAARVGVVATPVPLLVALLNWLPLPLLPP